MATERVRIELARSADAGVMAALCARHVESGLQPRWTRERVLREIRRHDTAAIVARSGAAVIGLALMNFGLDRAHLSLCAVVPAWRRQGIGRQLFAWLEESARTAGITLVTLELRAHNAAALAFYQRLGFEEYEGIARYYDGREAAIRMMRVLRYPDFATGLGAALRRLNDPSTNP